MKVLLRPTTTYNKKPTQKATKDQIEKSPNCSKL
jgi:hypothetical protein